MYALTMRPCGPDPRIDASSSPACAAIRRASGLADTRLPGGDGCAGAAGSETAAGGGAGAWAGASAGGSSSGGAGFAALG